MSNGVTIAAADAFFTVHLDRQYWAELNTDTKAAVLKMAERDVLGRLGWAQVPEDVPVVVDAVCEQAVYLARNYEELNEGKITTSENIDGVATGYSTISGDVALSVRAAVLIDCIKKRNRRGSVRLARG